MKRSFVMAALLSCMCVSTAFCADNGAVSSLEGWSLQPDITKLSATDSVFLRGKRATVEALLLGERAGRSAFSPLDAFNRLEVTCEPHPSPKQVRITPFSVEHTFAFANGGTVKSCWRVDADRPLLRVSYDLRAGDTEPLKCKVTALIASNVGWVQKFNQHLDDMGEAQDHALHFQKSDGSALSMYVWSVPAADDASISAKISDKPTPPIGDLTVNVDLAPGASRHFDLYVAASDDVSELSDLRKNPRVSNDATLLSDGFHFDCPDAGINEFVKACSITIPLNIRTLPFGEPYAKEAAEKNQRIPVLTASPDYHGIFANDCIQTLWEGGLLGKAMQQASRNSVDVMLHYGPVESVEWWTGNGEVWSYNKPLGDTPQIVMGACWRLLWSGDRKLADRWWPQIQRCLDVLKNNDADGDWLEDRVNTPYPEQPDPGVYNHEMLYVQCFWHQAYLKAAQVAEWLGKPEASQYRDIASKIATSIETKFATPYGLGVWLNKAHERHLHIGHEQIIAAEQGDVSTERARLIVKTEMSPPIWTDNGPLRANPGQGVAAGDHVWSFMRWKLVQALFRLGETDKAMELVKRWSAQERDMRYNAPEGFPTITGTTGKAYTWTAGRAMRAIVFGLTGLTLDGKGISFTPQLPAGWDQFDVTDIPVHDGRVGLHVHRGPVKIAVDNQAATTSLVPYAQLSGKSVRVDIWLP